MAVRRRKRAGRVLFQALESRRLLNSVLDPNGLLTVDGTGVPGNRSTPLKLTVSAAPAYALSLTPAALTIGQGANGTTTTRNGSSRSSDTFGSVAIPVGQTQQQTVQTTNYRDVTEWRITYRAK